MGKNSVIEKSFFDKVEDGGVCTWGKKREEYKKAKNHLIRAINLKNDEQDFHYNLAYCYKKLGDEKTAQKILDELSKN